jgi:hypothetical protein
MTHRFPWATSIAAVEFVGLIWLGWAQLSQNSASARATNLEEALNLLQKIRTHYDTYCDRNSETLKRDVRVLYERKIDLADIDERMAPWDRPCEFIGLPGVTTITSMDVSIAPAPSRYKDWDAFIAADPKRAFVWVDDSPITVVMETDDTNSGVEKMREAWNASHEQLADCTRQAREKPENIFFMPTCSWMISDENDARIVVVQARSSQ